MSSIAVVVFFFCLTLLDPIFLQAAMLPEQLDKRIQAHLVISDYQSACKEAAWGIEHYPESKLIWLAYLQALARSGNEKAMLSKWKVFIKKFPEEHSNRELLECFAWAVIDKGATSSSPLVRLKAIIGAFFSEDSKGIAILKKGLCDDNSLLRAFSVKFSSGLMDASLEEELFKLLQTEKAWIVRQALILAIGSLPSSKAKQELKKVIACDLCHVEEKALAIRVLVIASERIEADHLQKLVTSNRSGMRMLACELIAFFEQLEDVDKLFPLIVDNNADVRAKVFQTIGQLRVATIDGQSVVELAERAAKDPDPTVAIVAAWVLTINDPEKGGAIFERLLNHQNADTRYLAAAALATTGKYGLNTMQKAFNQNKDNYVKMNLALGLIGQRVDITIACDCLFLGLSQHKDRWSWAEDRYFRVLTPNKIKQSDVMPNYPEAVNQLTRLDILQILAKVHYVDAQEAIKKFLKQSSGETSRLVSALLLEEGDEEAIDLVKNLLSDEDPEIKIQAALILAMWGHDDALYILQEHYASANPELKGLILEGIAQSGSKESLFFLVEKLQEPYQTLRIISAAALLQCLYH